MSACVQCSKHEGMVARSDGSLVCPSCFGSSTARGRPLEGHGARAPALTVDPHPPGRKIAPVVAFRIPSPPATTDQIQTEREPSLGGWLDSEPQVGVSSDREPRLGGLKA